MASELARAAKVGAIVLAVAAALLFARYGTEVMGAAIYIAAVLLHNG